MVHGTTDVAERTRGGGVGLGQDDGGAAVNHVPLVHVVLGGDLKAVRERLLRRGERQAQLGLGNALSREDSLVHHAGALQQQHVARSHGRGAGRHSLTTHLLGVGVDGLSGRTVRAHTDDVSGDELAALHVLPRLLENEGWSARSRFDTPARGTIPCALRADSPCSGYAASPASTPSE